MPLHVRPLGGNDAVHHAVPNRAVAAGLMMAYHAVLPHSQRLDCPLRGKVEVVGPKPHDSTAQRLEGMPEQEQFAGGIHVTTLPACGIPGVADLYSIDLRRNIVVPGAAHDSAGAELADGPGEHVAGSLPAQSFGDVRTGLGGLGNGREPELPEPAVRSRSGQSILVSCRQGLQPDSTAFERDWGRSDHGRVTPGTRLPGNRASPPP